MTLSVTAPWQVYASIGAIMLIELVITYLLIRKIQRRREDAESRVLETLDKLEQYASDLFNSVSEIERAATRIADATEEISTAARGRS